ncbi:MAG: hypothetical protein R2747_19510 [Pyrinomonadaceae bacterium]
MRKTFWSFLLASAFLFFLVSTGRSQLNVKAIDVAGDSISKGFNARSTFPCSNGDKEQYNWITSDTHGTDSCGAGAEGVYSLLERLECQFGGSIAAPNPNSAMSGAQLLTDFLNQTNSIKTYLSGQSSPRLAAVFLGHNDACTNTITKTNASCSSNDLDPNNYCRTKNDSFERELRKGLDVLMTIPDTRVGVVAPVRVSQLCNFGSKANCQFGGTCQFLWGLANICGSLTNDCSAIRITDAYNTLKGYRQILKDVTEEYAAIPIGGNSPVVIIGGQMVGGATKASGVDFVYSDAPWFYRFSSEQLSCCDCFHPSAFGQDTLGRLMKDGLTCSRINPCCRDTGNALVDGKCTRPELKRVHYRGLF